MNETDPTAGERCKCADVNAMSDPRLPPVSCPRCTPAEPDAGDAETYCGAEMGEARSGECECPKCAPDAGDVEALAKAIYNADLPSVVVDVSEATEIARAILASDWLDAVRRKARQEGADERAEQIAQAIEGERIAGNGHANQTLNFTARIARESRHAE